jgi:hypothetical protein
MRFLSIIGSFGLISAVSPDGEQNGAENTAVTNDNIRLVRSALSGRKAGGSEGKALRMDQIQGEVIHVINEYNRIIDAGDSTAELDKVDDPYLLILYEILCEMSTGYSLEDDCFVIPNDEKLDGVRVQLAELIFKAHHEEHPVEQIEAHSGATRIHSFSERPSIEIEGKWMAGKLEKIPKPEGPITAEDFRAISEYDFVRNFNGFFTLYDEMEIKPAVPAMFYLLTTIGAVWNKMFVHVGKFPNFVMDGGQKARLCKDEKLTDAAVRDWLKCPN